MNTGNKIDRRTIDSELVKQYILKNYRSFDIVALIELIEVAGYSIEDINFRPTSLPSAEKGYVENVLFTGSGVDVTVNDYNIAIFMDKIANDYPDEQTLCDFFNTLFSRIIKSSIYAICPEKSPHTRETYIDGEILASKYDCSMRSFAYIYNSLRKVLSEYNLVIYKEVRPYRESVSNFYIGRSDVGSRTDRLCGINIYDKLFVVIRIYSEYPMTKSEQSEIRDRIEEFIQKHSDFIPDLNIAVENYVTDEELYSILPVRLTYGTILVNNLFTLFNINYKQ